MVKKTLKIRRKKNNTYNKTKIYNSKAKNSQKRKMKNRKNSQKRKMKGGHSYTKRLLEMTTRGGYDNNEKEGFTPSELKISDDKNKHLNETNKLVEKKILDTQIKGLPDVSRKLTENISSMNVSKKKKKQDKEFVNNLTNITIQNSKRKQRKFGKKEGEKVLKDIEEYSRKLNKENLSNDGYNKKLKEYSEKKMNDIVDNFQNTSIQQKLSKLKNVDESINKIEDEDIKKGINDTGELINNKIVEKVEKYQKTIDKNENMTDDEKFAILGRESQNIARNIGEKIQEILQKVPYQERKKFMFSKQFQNMIKQL